MSLLVPIFLASFVLFQVFDLEVGKPKETNKVEVAISETQSSENNEGVDINNNVIIEKPKEELKIEEPKEEVKVEEPNEELKAEESKEEVKVEEPDNQNSSEQKTETILQDVNISEEQESDTGINWLIVALYIFLGIFLLATASYYFINRNKNNQKPVNNEEPTSSNEESSDQDINTPLEERNPNPGESIDNENNQSNNLEENNLEEDNKDNKNN